MFTQTLPPNSNADFTGNPSLGEDVYIPLLFYDPVSFPHEIELKKYFFIKIKSDPQK